MSDCLDCVKPIHMEHLSSTSPIPVMMDPQEVLRSFRPDIILEVEAAESANLSAVTAEVDGRTFQSVGFNPDHAKQCAALNVINYLQESKQIEVPEDKLRVLSTWAPRQDEPMNLVREIEPSNMSPLMYFNQITVKISPKWEVSQISTLPSMFKAVVTINEKAYEGIDSTKKMAKQKAAEAALLGQFGINWSDYRVPSVAKKRGLEDVDLQDSSSQGNSDADGTPMPTPSRRKRKQADGGTPTFSKAKNPLQILNEFRRGIVFNMVSQEGPSHAPTITVATEVEGKSFQRESTSKQKAKSLLANDLVSYFVETGQMALVEPLETTPITDTDTTLRTPTPVKTCVNSPAKTPLMMLYELTRNQPPCEVTEFEENKTKRFVASYCINGQTFKGEGLSKQRAKHRAAEMILRDLFGVTSGNIGSGGDIGTDGARSSVSDVRYLQFGDRVRRMVMEKWRELGESLLNEEYAKRKVLAGIIVTRDATAATSASPAPEIPGLEDTDSNDSSPPGPLYESEEVLCLTTGTKCLGGEFLNGQGTALNDCHAEVLSTRCLRLLLLEDIERLVSGEQSRLVERNDQDSRFRVKPGVRFHLYISTAPCGDGRIFCPHELGDLSSDTHPGRRSRGLLRTKIESGEGTIPVMTNGTGLQTFDGVIQGERLLTMSCSDKLCLWNAVGAQGSLLSLLLEAPVYYECMVIGSVFAESHLERALYGRISGMKESLTEPFQLFKPKFIATTERDERQPRKSPNISVVWINGIKSEATEIVVAPRGKQEGDLPSVLCKQGLFSRFCRIKRAVPWLADLGVHSGDDAAPKEEPLPLLYAEAKQLARDYCVAKRAIQKHFKLAGLGSWTRRPIEQDLFELVE